MEAPQPMAEVALLRGPLELTNELNAIAKVAGIKLARAFRGQHGRHYIWAMSTNLYGPGVNFDLQTSHVLPALILKAYEVRRTGSPFVEKWGRGTPPRVPVRRRHGRRVGLSVAKLLG